MVTLNVEYISPNSTWLVNRHASTRHATQAIYILAWGKVVPRRVALDGQHGATCSSQQARLARHVFRGVATAWTGVDMSTSLSPEIVSPEFAANPEHKKTKLVHASTTASSSSAMLKQARLDTLYVSCRCVETWRAKWNLDYSLYSVFFCASGCSAGIRCESRLQLQRGSGAFSALCQLCFELNYLHILEMPDDLIYVFYSPKTAANTKAKKQSMCKLQPFMVSDNIQSCMK